VTNHAPRGDSRVTRTIQEPPGEPSSSSPGPPAAGAEPGGGIKDQSPADALDLLPETVRHHPTVIPSAIIKRLRALDDLGWPRAEIRRRLSGIETADRPGAARPNSARRVGNTEPTLAATAASSLVWTMR
jgi:hypothetical protein